MAFERRSESAVRSSGAQSLLDVRYRFLAESGRRSVSILIRSAAAFATMRPVLLLMVR